MKYTTTESVQYGIAKRLVSGTREREPLCVKSEKYYVWGVGIANALCQQHSKSIQASHGRLLYFFVCFEHAVSI